LISDDLAALAEKYYSIGNFQVAADLCRQALTFDPSHPQALNNLGVICAASGQPAEAAAFLRRAIVANPAMSDARTNLAALSNSEKKWREIGPGALVIGMPCWNIDYPFYSLMVVAGIVESAGIQATIADLNIGIYNLLPTKERRFWTESDPNDWLPGGTIAENLFMRYREQITNALLKAAGNAPYGMFLLSVNMSNRFFTEQAVAILKDAYPQTPVMLGGVDCFPMEHGKRFLALPTSPDIICQGEAEIALREFLGEYKQTRSLQTTIPGFAGFEAGSYFDSGEPSTPDLKRESPMPSLNGIDFASYRSPGDFPLFSSRGCINRCAFCSESPNFKHFRFRRADQTFAELQKTLHAAEKFNNSPTVHFADSLINGAMHEFIRFCELIIENNVDVKWGGQAFFRKEMTRDVLSLARQAGCQSFFWGLESASQPVIDRMGKNYNLNVARRILFDCHELGIGSNLPLIIGFPGEACEDIAKTAIFIDEFRGKANFLEPNTCCIRPNSPLHERYGDFDLSNNDYTEWESMDGSNTILVRTTRKAIIRTVIKHESRSRKDYEEEILRLSMDSTDPIVATEIDTFITLNRDLRQAAEAFQLKYHCQETLSAGNQPAVMA
jgi:anaerobic magnesium-protoporphyrin IX monomethyl ester cyclase